MTDTPPCCARLGAGVKACPTTAVLAYRLIPKRTDTPLCPCVERALQWPGVAAPVDLFACTAHTQEIKDQGRVLGCRALGAETVFHKVESLLLQLGQTVTPVGGNGAGAVLKLAINISLAVQTLAFSEGLLLAERSGLDPKLAAEVMSTSPIGSPMLKARVPLLLDLPDDAWFSIRLMRKDISLALAQARRLAVATPAATTASWVFAQADALDLAERDIAAIHNILDEMSSETRLPVAG